MNAHWILQKILLIILFTTGFAGSSTIKGKITDIRSGEPLIGANIMLSGTMLGSATNENGDYLISDVPIGSFTIVAMFIGYETIEKEIQVAADLEYTVNLTLKASAIELQETKVTAEKREEKITSAPASMEIITSRDIKGKTTTNMGAYLKGLKGIDFTSSGINNYSISIRGFNSSFSTRLLTLSDSRVANIPALRVINYSSIPQSMDDVDKIEVVLGPATALYGANAHSGVVNIISKPPAKSEGFTMSISGSNDERQLRKINGRFAKKLSNAFSIKISGLYLHAYDWPFISETEYKTHLYPWSSAPGRFKDGKDNNPGTDFLAEWVENNEGDLVLIGDGEPSHGCSNINIDSLNQASCTDAGYHWYDPDGDGVAGEDWWNGYDDDGDGLIDEDYFVADGVDNDGDGLIDEDIDYSNDINDDGVDNDGNGIIDDESSWGANIENNILIKEGRQDSLINGKINPFYVPNLTWRNNGMDLRGNHRFNEEKVKLEFDIFAYDFGQDGLPGDPFIDENENGIWDEGEVILDWGHDGLENTGDAGEHDGELAMDGFMGEPFIDLNGDGIYKHTNELFDDNGQPVVDENGVPIIVYEEYDDINHNDKYDGPTGEFDGIFDTGDGLFGFEGEPFIDENENGLKDPNEEYTDTNNDGLYNAPDLLDDFQVVLDNNGDGLSDYPDFEIDNRKVEFRLDYDPNPNFNMTFQSGYSKTKTQQVTGTGRYIADGFEYKFYQLRSRYKNWFSQFYMNESFSGNTRGYNLGNRIIDKSKNYAFQIQNNFDLKPMNTKFVWGADYFRTEPKTFGTILNDGPNGYDNDGDQIPSGEDGIDNDGDGLIDEDTCSDGQKNRLKNGKIWRCGDGIDEPDEFDDPTSNEYGIYYQTTTELFGTSRYELITAARFDYHDLLAEGLLFAPKIGFNYKPNSKSSMRFTYGRAHNTPNSITLFTDLFIAKAGVLNIYLRGNKDGTPYCRVGQPCFGSESYSVVEPGFWSEDGETFYTMGTLDDPTYFDKYNERVDGAPYFFKTHVDGSLLAGDMTPLDTSLYVIFVPELNGDGVLYTPQESMNLPDVDPIKTEKIQTVEFGYKGFLGNRTHFSLDYYLSYYEDFFSPPTIITPLIVNRQFDDDGNDITTVYNYGEVAGLMPINDIGTNPPYGTAWNGLDDDGDWAEWAEEFGWLDDKNGDCPYGAATYDPCMADPGEWGGVLFDDASGTWGGVTYGPGDIFHPYEVLNNEENGYPQWNDTFESELKGKWTAVGVDELHSATNLSEYELVQTGLVDSNGDPLISDHGNARKITDIVLSPMNYGEVWMQGLDFGLTHFLTENIIIDGNVSWYGTTEFYNELTRKNDPINAPKWKWNASIKGTSGIGDFILNFRHVDRFKWSDGIWAGIIGPYNIIDLFYTYHITDNLDFNISALNLNNDLHKELVGGAIMGRQIVTRLTSTF
ncbi:MAG: TonB-dependent receptor [Candidatus Marinimicrobia bacterium]|nr:TonB-dependent receptor [Candidatus Neomarinimicrobiota bacterium]